MKKLIWGLIAGMVLAGLYFIDANKIEPGKSTLPTLDHLNNDETAKAWAPFYKVRAKIIDGQSAKFSIPKELKDNEGNIIALSGAAVFYGSGCKRREDSTLVNDFFLLPTTGLADACELQPDEAMRWTIRVSLDNSWMIHRNDMILAEVMVRGRFRIDTSKPYESAFFIDEAEAELITNDE